MTQSWHEACDALRRDTLVRLTEVSEGVSLCRLSGERVDAAKYLEGKASFHQALRRELGSSRLDLEDPPCSPTLARVAKLLPESRLPDTEQSAAWVAYRAGWADALSEVAELCRESGSHQGGRLGP